MKNNFYISFAVWLVILPMLGVPIVWKNLLVLLSGLFLMAVSLGPIILKKLQTKPASKRKKETENSDKLKFSANEDSTIQSPN